MSSSSYTILPVVSRVDLDATAQLFEEYVRWLNLDLTSEGYSDEVASLPGKYASPSGALFLARSAKGHPLGCVALRPIQPEGCCEMKRLYVAPEGRRLGLGKALLETVINTVREIGYTRLRLDTLPMMTTAIELYKKMGFVTIEPYYETPLEGSIFLEKTIQR